MVCYVCKSQPEFSYGTLVYTCVSSHETSHCQAGSATHVSRKFPKYHAPDGAKDLVIKTKKAVQFLRGFETPERRKPNPERPPKRSDSVW